MKRLATLTLLLACTLACPADPKPDAKKGEASKTDKAPPEIEPKTEPAKTEPAKTEPAKVEPTPEPEPPKLAVSTGECNEVQAAISKQADERAAPYGIMQHLEKNFPDMKVSWLMKDKPYQTYVVETKAEKFGRCNETACYLFAAPTAVIQAAVDKAKTDAGHDPAILGQSLGLPAANFEGPLRMMTLDLAATKSCVRLPVDEDPGVWKCKSEEDKDCFKFGGYTSGGVPEIMVLDAPVAQATVTEIQ